MADFIIGDYEYTRNNSGKRTVVESIDILAFRNATMGATLTHPPFGNITLSGAAWVSESSQPSFTLVLPVSSSVTTASNTYCRVTYNPLDKTLTLTTIGAMFTSISTATFDTTDTLSVNVVDRTKSSYEDIPSIITYRGDIYRVTNMGSCFYNCTNLIVAPVIPYNVVDMYSCFEKCTLLTGDIYIQNTQLVSYSGCFQNTTQPITLHGNDISTLEALASTANNNNVYINTTPTTLPSTIECTPMNYMTDNGLVQLSPQTDASLISVQVPNGSGTIITTLEDALVDLYQRVGDA